MSQRTRPPPTKVVGSVPKVKAYKDKEPNKPYFPANFVIECYETLQWFDLQSNHNKYYVLELHRAEEQGKPYFRLFSHYGRTDDLVKSAASGMRDHRFYNTLVDAENGFVSIIQEKTMTKGYRKVSLVFSKIGSPQLQALMAQSNAEKEVKAHAFHAGGTIIPETSLHPEVQDLVKFLYHEATTALSSSLGPANITANGIETPLGVIGMSQIEAGEATLLKLFELFKLGDHSAPETQSKVMNLSNEFYTTIPHSVGGRDRSQISKALIDNMRAFEEKQELLQLMKDMLTVSQQTKASGVNLSDLDMKYFALGSRITFLEPGSDQYNHIQQYVTEGQVGDDRNQVSIKSIYAIQRPLEWEAFSKCPVQHNRRLLYHGSRCSNFVGLLSRGVLMPKMVVAMGGKRRDAGLLGHGIYFGDSVTTSAQYTNLGSMRSSRLMLLNNVALGTVKDYTKVMFGLTEAPEGFHSVHGVRGTSEAGSEFKDDEYVIFNTNQQQQEYLVEFRLNTDPVAVFTTPQAKVAPSPALPVAQPVKVPVSSSSSTSVKAKPAAAVPATAAAKKTEEPAAEPESLFTWPTSEPLAKADPPKKKLWTSSSSNSTGSSLLSGSLKLQSSGLTTGGLTSSVLTTAVNVPSGLSSLRKSQQGTTPAASLDHSPKKPKLAKSPSAGLLGPSGLETKVIADIETESDDGQHRGVKRDSADVVAEPPSKKQKLRLSTGSTGSSSATFALRTSGGGLISAESTDPLRLSSESNSTALPNAAGSVAKTAVQGLRTHLAPGAPMSRLQALIGKENAKIKHKEDKLRELFVKDRNNFAIADAHAHLVDVYKNTSSFAQEFEGDEEVGIPKLLTKMRLHVRAKEPAILPSFQEFKAEFDSLTRNVFEDMDWKNVVVAGGAVLSALVKLDEKEKNNFRDADVDLFLFGLSEEQAAQKVKDIFFQIQSRTNASCQIVRTRHAVTILGQYPNRHIQVILRLYKSPAEVLMGFDIDCCCVCYDGSAVWALPRAKRAICKRFNLVDMSRRSLTYETRLYKYAKRGFAVAVPGLQRQLIEPAIYDKRPWQVHGLAKLLIFEHDVNTRAPRASRVADPSAAWKPVNPRHQRYQIYAKDEYTEDRINEFEAVEDQNAPDYSNIFIPWGPQWKLSKIMKHLEHRDKAFFFAPDSKRHMVLVGLEGVLEGKRPSWDKLTGPANTMPHGAFVEGPIKFLLENPGRQILSGSFHPVDDDLWFNDCYLSDPQRELVQHFVDASFGNRMEVLNTLVRKAGKQLDVNVVDFFPQSRSALSYAALFDHAEVARLLLDKGASVSAMDSSTGFQPLHYAALAGNTTLFETLVQRGARVSSATRDQNWTPLHFASYFRHIDLLKTLLNEHGAAIDLNAPDVQQRTPIFLASLAGHLDVVQLLKQAGAKIDLKDFSQVSPLDMAAKNGHRAIATLFIAELKPQYPPVIQDIPQTAGTSSERASALFISEAVSHDLFHAHDGAGQTILHYAVRHGEIYLVKKLLQARIKSGAEVEARAFRGIKFDVSALASDSKHVDLDAENIFGQTPLYYAQQLLSNVSLPAGVPAPVGDSSNLFGLPKFEQLRNWVIIRELLVAAGATAPHLLYHRELPEVKDDSMSNLLTRQAQASREEFKRLEAYEQELERQAQEEAKKEQEKQKAKFPEAKSKKRRAPNSPPAAADTSDPVEQPFKAAAAAIPKSTGASFSAGVGSGSSSSGTASAASYSIKYVSEVLSKAEPVEPFKPPVESLVSLTSAPTFAGGSGSVSLSAFGGGSASSSSASNLSAFGGSALSASSVMIGGTPAKRQTSSASSKPGVTTAPSTSILKSDIAILLARVIGLAKANVIGVAEKAVLKTLALQRNRHMIAALRAFQVDSDEEEFNDTLRTIYSLNAH